MERSPQTLQSAISYSQKWERAAFLWHHANDIYWSYIVASYYNHNLLIKTNITKFSHIQKFKMWRAIPITKMVLNSIWHPQFHISNTYFHKSNLDNKELL